MIVCQLHKRAEKTKISEILATIDMLTNDKKYRLGGQEALPGKSPSNM
jgi:hypothetical protein